MSQILGALEVRGGLGAVPRMPDTLYEMQLAFAQSLDLACMLVFWCGVPLGDMRIVEERDQWSVRDDIGRACCRALEVREGDAWRRVHAQWVECHREHLTVALRQEWTG